MDHLKIIQEESAAAVRIAFYLSRKFAPVQLVYDFGCSSGLYLWPFSLMGIVTEGWDSDEEAAKHSQGLTKINLQDLTQSIVVEKKSDVTICLEVLEHIEEGKSDIVLDNICGASGKWLLFSAAAPGAEGDGHINCQPNQYWINKLESRGWIVDYNETLNFLRYLTSGYHLGWAMNSLVFRKFRSPEESNEKLLVG